MAFRFRHLGLIDVRLERDTFASCQWRRVQGARDGITPADSRRDLLCELLAVRSSLGIRGFSWVGEEAAFYKYCWNCCLSQNIETAAPHSSIGRGRSTRDIIMNGRSERQAIAAIKICFNTAGAHTLCRVEVNADEDGVAVRVRDCNPRRQGHKDIAVPGHHYAIATGCQKAFKALRDVKGHFLFCNHLTGNPAAVKTAMTGIDYHGGRRASTLSRAAPRCSRGSAARHSCNR